MAQGHLDAPGTEILIDVGPSKDLEHHEHGSGEIVLIPTPTKCAGDPVNWSKRKKYYQLLLVALYACAFSYQENKLGAAWNTVSKDTGVTLTNMNGGSALNYLLLGFTNIWWVPAANKIGRRFVFLASTIITAASSIWAGAFHGTPQWMLNNAMNGIGTAAYQAIIQLTIFDTFFAHQRGQSLSLYLFAQQLGSILGLITGGIMTDAVGWRWGQYICAMMLGVVLLIFFFTFEETLFPRFLFGSVSAECHPETMHSVQAGDDKIISYQSAHKRTGELGNSGAMTAFVDPFPRRTYLQMLKLWVYFPENKTTYMQYFRRPFFLFAFPNVVIAGLIYAFGCTAGIVSFNTISRILTEPPYNFSNTATGLMFLAALVGNFVGLAVGMASDPLVILLARRNGGVKEPEMRLYMLVPCALFASVGYFTYGWGAEAGSPWIIIGVGIAAMIAHQVGACSIATAYAMECFPQISGELVVILALCSSMINFALSYSVQPLINAVGYGWAFTFFSICVLASMLAAIPLMWYGKSWRAAKASRYYKFLEDIKGGTP